tara:strand:- start:475 stop:960 length:486 start_codon:yes stop_codon:yes gene_type:complete
MKNPIFGIGTLGLALVLSTAAHAKKVNGEVTHHYTTVNEWIEVVKPVCYSVDVPVYKTITRKGNAGGGALLGAILGGVTGKAITKDDGGAAAGALFGAIVGADQGSKLQTERVIIGYNKSRECVDEIVWKSKPIRQYSYSTVVFQLNGREYNIEFIRGENY